MNRWGVWVVFAGLLLCFHSPLWASETLSLETALSMAMEQNPNVLIASQNLQQARQGLRAAWAKALPAISAGAGYQRTFDKSEFVLTIPPGTEMRMETGADHTMNGALILEQPLFAGGAIAAGIGMARNGVTIADQALGAARQQTLETVYSAFYAVLLSQSLLSVSQTAVQNAQVNLDQVQRRFKEGAASRFELLRAEVQLATIRPGLTEAKNRYEVAIEHLKDLVGMEKGREVVLTGDFKPRGRTLAGTPLDELVAKAYAHRPEYRMQQLQKDISEKKITLARAEFLPALGLSAAAQWQGLRDDLHFVRDDFDRTTYLGLSLRIPLFNGFGSTARYSEATAELKKTKIQEANLKNVIATEIRAVSAELTQAAEVLGSQAQVMEQAREGVRLANLLYAEGAATQLEVIDAQLALTQASTSYYRSIYNFNTASIKLERACGILTPESIREDFKTEAR